MQSVFRANKHVASISKTLRPYSTIAISPNEDVASVNDVFKSSPVTTTTSTTSTDQMSNSQIKTILQNLPSARLIDSYRTSSLHATVSPDVETTRNYQIRQELIKLREERNYNNLLALLQIWSARDIDNMVEVLGHDVISDYLTELISFGHLAVHQHYNLNPILKSLKLQKNETTRIKSRRFTPREKNFQIRTIYKNLIYNSSSKDFFYDLERRQDIYKSENLTGYKLTIKDFENLIQLELNNFKLDNASRWFKLFRKYFGGNDGFQKFMTPKLWQLVFQLEANGENKHWVLKGTELSMYKVNPLSDAMNVKKFKKFLNFSFSDFQDESIWPDLTLDFHGAVVQHFGYNGNLSQLKKYVQFIWGVDESGKLVGKKLNPDDRLYPDMNLLKNLFVSLSYSGEFFSAIKYVNDFQAIYDSIKGYNPKVFWERVFNRAHITTLYDEECAFKYFLKQSNYSNISINLDDAQKDVNFDYEGYLQFMEKLKTERRNVFGQIWKIVDNENEIAYSNYIYKTYLNYLKEEIEENVEQSYFNYLSSLLKQYHFYYTDPASFTRKSELGFTPTPKYDEFIRVLYNEAIRALIDYKGMNLLIGQIEPLIEKWSIDEEMKQELHEWVNEERMIIYKENLETKRAEYMNNLMEQDSEEDDKFLSLL